MRYRAKIFKSDRRKLTNGKNEFFSQILKPTSHQMKIMSKGSKRARKKYGL